MRRQKPTGEAEQKYQADVALAAQLTEFLDAARKAESRLRQVQALRAPEAGIRRLAEDLDAALTAAMQAAYAAQRAEIGPRGYDDRIYRRKAKAKPGVHALTAQAEHLLTLRETHRLNGIPAVEFKPGPLAAREVRMPGDPPAENAPVVPQAAAVGGGGMPRAMKLLVGGLILSAPITLGLSIYFQVSGATRSLTAATWGLLVVIVLWVSAALGWGMINPPAAEEPDLSKLLRGAANVVITVDGVVLGLVYAFLGMNKTSTPLVVKVGALALVTGVVLALLLYSLVAGKITTPAAVAFATGLFSLISWALAYGLLCIVFAVVFSS